MYIGISLEKKPRSQPAAILTYIGVHRCRIYYYIIFRNLNAYSTLL